VGWQGVSKCFASKVIGPVKNVLVIVILEDVIGEVGTEHFGILVPLGSLPDERVVEVRSGTQLRVLSRGMRGVLS